MTVTLTLPDLGRDLKRVRLVTDLFKRRPPPEFGRDRNGSWRLRLPLPPAHRIEYQLELVHADGTRRLVVDPTNPRTASGPFGDKSVLELPEYEPPVWIDDDEAPAGEVRRIRLRSRYRR